MKCFAMENPENYKETPRFVEAKKKQVLLIPDKELLHNETIALDLEFDAMETKIILEGNARCVSVDTILPAPLGRSEKKSFKGKIEIVKFRCTLYEKKLLKIKALRAGLSLSEFFRRAAFDQTIKERFTEEHIELYKMLLKYHNNFKSIGNMYRARNPKLDRAVSELAKEIKEHLQRFES